ncbi:MAG: GAF domain-containing protein [Anaerolineae bacterium]|nr:GAF domain-containing protein [Anaerolineae bacterium]
MSVVSTITLLSNALTLALALGFLIIVLWQDIYKELNQFFAVFLLLVILWNMGSLLALGFSLVDPRSTFITIAVSIMELGFTGSSIAIYALSAILVGVHTKRFRILAFLALLIVLAYQVFLVVANAPIGYVALGDGFFRYRFQLFSTIFYLMFDGAALYLIWRYRRKVRSYGLLVGLNLFILGQTFGFLNPELQIVSLSINLCSIATLMISFSILRQEIITPLADRVRQVEAVHKVSLAITSHISIDTVLNQIATQATGWLNADAAGIFLTVNDELELVTVHNLPDSYIHAHVLIGEGVVGVAAKTQQSIYLENYNRDWRGKTDLPLAKDVFGSVISVPLIYRTETIGVLLVIAGRQGELFLRDDVQLLELLAAQAAVAIAHSHSFEEQRKLTSQVEAARSQLETVLISTENPVIAVNRQLQIIFVNPAARSLLPDGNLPNDQIITEIVPSNTLPYDYHEMLRDLRHNRAHIYEIAAKGRVYLCHLAQIGRPKAVGWVAVLNDVTQLKELDRLKSEMVRMTSHDLKNPLQAAMANLDLLTEDLSNNDTPEVQLSLSAIGKQLARMNRIIGGILDLERIKTGTISMSPCIPEQLVRNVVEEIRHLADDQRITLVTHLNQNIPTIWVDPEQFERALINLIENAIKFTPSGGEVAIEVAFDQKSNGVIFEVRDTGIGIPIELQPHVFDRFWRGAGKGQEGAEHISGTGLGLSLVKTIVENHHGEIWLNSQLNQGTRFFIRLPIRSA